MCVWAQRFTFGSGELDAFSHRVGSNSFRLLESHWFSNSSSHVEITLWRLKKAIPPDIFCRIHFDFTQNGLSSLTQCWKRPLCGYQDLQANPNINSIDAVCISRGLWHDCCSYLMSSNYNGTLINVIKTAPEVVPHHHLDKNTHISVSEGTSGVCLQSVCWLSGASCLSAQRLELRARRNPSVNNWTSCQLHTHTRTHTHTPLTNQSTHPVF